jgi:hypothetical protein
MGNIKIVKGVFDTKLELEHAAGVVIHEIRTLEKK